jgi:glucan biosynthesis protein C
MFWILEAMSKTSLPLKNLRGMLILLILSFHSFSAYIVSQPLHPLSFDSAHYDDWRAFPIIDTERWIGFDLFCAFQFLYLMQLMFFLSGLFVWPSLLHKGCKAFLSQRLLRLGAPFVLGTYLLMPVAYYPAYRVTAVDPDWSSFWSRWTALSITPSGPMWFLWFLIALNIGAAALYALAPSARNVFAPLFAKAMAPAHTGRILIIVICASAAAYFPLSAIYPPWQWIEIGPFELQPAIAAQYLIYFFLGLAVGAYGYQRGLLDVNGMLARRWAIWVVASFASFLLWVIPTALIMKVPGVPVAGLRVAGDLGLVIFVGTTCCAMTAVFLRFATTRWPVIDNISEHAYGMYFFHYVFVLWLQFMLLGRAIPAIGKASIVLIITVILSWAASVGTNRILASAHLLLGRGATLIGAPSAANGRLRR